MANKYLVLNFSREKFTEPELCDCLIFRNSPCELPEKVSRLVTHVPNKNRFLIKEIELIQDMDRLGWEHYAVRTESTQLESHYFKKHLWEEDV